MRSLKLSLIASVALAAPISAHALTTGLGTNYSLPTLVLMSTGPNSGSVTGTVSGTITGGQVLSSSTSGVATKPVAPTPPSGTDPVGNFLSAGPSATSPSTLLFSTAVGYVSFLWGTPDTYNSLTVNYLLNGMARSTTYTAAALGLNPNQASSSDAYVNFTAGAGEQINSLSFASTQNAFETANFRVGAAVPGPIAGAGIPALLALGGMLWMRRRARA